MAREHLPRWEILRAGPCHPGLPGDGRYACRSGRTGRLGRSGWIIRAVVVTFIQISKLVLLIDDCNPVPLLVPGHGSLDLGPEGRVFPAVGGKRADHQIVGRQRDVADGGPALFDRQLALVSPAIGKRAGEAVALALEEQLGRRACQDERCRSAKPAICPFPQSFLNFLCNLANLSSESSSCRPPCQSKSMIGRTTG